MCNYKSSLKPDCCQLDYFGPLSSHLSHCVVCEMITFVHTVVIVETVPFQWWHRNTNNSNVIVRSVYVDSTFIMHVMFYPVGDYNLTWKVHSTRTWGVVIQWRQSLLFSDHIKYSRINKYMVNWLTELASYYYD